jgi:hypothetical protein
LHGTPLSRWDRSNSPATTVTLKASIDARIVGVVRSSAGIGIQNRLAAAIFVFPFPFEGDVALERIPAPIRVRLAAVKIFVLPAMRQLPHVSPGKTFQQSRDFTAQFA